MSTLENTDLPPDQQSATAERILDCARVQIQRRGYNAVSYGDLAEELDLTTTAIHYHFPSKADLGQALVRRYRQTNKEARAAIWDEVDTFRGRLEQYVDGYVGLMENGGLCLCGVLSSEVSTLPEAIRQEVRTFFHEQEDWLTKVIDAGTTDGGGHLGCESPRDAAKIVLAAIEGAMLTTPDRSGEAYAATLQHLVDSVVT